MFVLPYIGNFYVIVLISKIKSLSSSEMLTCCLCFSIRSCVFINSDLALPSPIQPAYLVIRTSIMYNDRLFAVRCDKIYICNRIKCTWKRHRTIIYPFKPKPNKKRVIRWVGFLWFVATAILSHGLDPWCWEKRLDVEKVGTMLKHVTGVWLHAYAIPLVTILSYYFRITQSSI